jgi:hypothetical protein
MVRTSVVKSPDVENNFTSRCNVNSASISRYQLSVETYKSCGPLVLSFVFQ